MLPNLFITEDTVTIRLGAVFLSKSFWQERERMKLKKKKRKKRNEEREI